MDICCVFHVNDVVEML